MSSSGAEAGVKGDQAVVVVGGIGCVGDKNCGLGGRTDGGRGGDGRYRDGDVLSWWEDNVENVTLGTEPKSILYYDPVL